MTSVKTSANINLTRSSTRVSYYYNSAYIFALLGCKPTTTIAHSTHIPTTLILCQVHAPPGGSSSIDLGGGGYEKPVPLVKVTAPVVVVEPPTPPTVEEEAADDIASETGKLYIFNIIYMLYIIPLFYAN
jgi:hypothetical protein